ncbi:MAG TPA: VWA domain-containing protein [Candidatus Acidoferrum sp.]|nr:VWA domain-containing protein [Candidatus Acidoferrum sp.]
MISTPLRSRFAAIAILAALFAASVSSSQDKPDRPPWAQKPKPAVDSTSASAPGPPGTIVPTPTQPISSPKDADSQRDKIKVKVDLVSILASVLDDHNRPAPDLPIEAFQVYEDGVQQKIEVFESETQQPLDLALMIDASLSAHKEITFEQEAAARFIRQVLRPSDRLSVFAFDENVTQIAKFSDDVPTLQAAVRRIPAGAGTSIYDAVLLGAQALERRGEGRRRVIVLVTDAGETTSRTDFEAARKEAVRSDLLLYTIVIRPVKNESGRNTAGEHALETITETTGGAMFYPDMPQELNVIFDVIDRELRTQYRLGYYPNPRGPANTYRNVDVKVLNGDYHVRHRRTYLTGQQ